MTSEGAAPVAVPTPPAVMPSRARRFAVIASLYLVSDIGYAFFFGALTTILLQRGVPLSQLALINLLGLLYFGRFLLGPLIDRLGRYRGWLMITQAALVLVWLALVPLDPGADLIMVLALTAVALALSAFHDTAMNGLTVRLLPPADRGIGNGLQAGMACLSIILGTGGALFLYARLGWGFTVGAVVVIFLIPFLVLLPLREPPSEPGPERHRRPFAELITLVRRPRIGVWMMVILPIFTVGGFLASALLAPMMIAAHWSMDRIALVQGTLSGPAGLLASLLIGALMNRIGRRGCAILVGCCWTASIALLLPLSFGGAHPVLDGIAVLSTVLGYSGAALCAYTVSMDLSRPASAATDLTAQVSVLGVLRLVITPAALALAGVTSFAPLIGVAVLLSGIGTWVTARWLRRHPISSTTSKEDT
ncbi:MFS transporter [Microlunatus sp. GCM10028923]|uniref:MFS transporter n=1 Tax=Microlunatus sp. GCM10028923 TaxID=3273400 RepID=UPI003613C954